MFMPAVHASSRATPLLWQSLFTCSVHVLYHTWLVKNAHGVQDPVLCSVPESYHCFCPVSVFQTAFEDLHICMRRSIHWWTIPKRGFLGWSLSMKVIGHLPEDRLNSAYQPMVRGQDQAQDLSKSMEIKALCRCVSCGSMYIAGRGTHKCLKLPCRLTSKSLLHQSRCCSTW